MPQESPGTPPSVPPDDVADPLIGRIVAGKFAIETRLGQGAMGAVYRARQLALDKYVAIKVLHSDHANDASYAERFRREARAASRLDHPNSIRVFDFGEEPDGLLYLAMEYVEGRDLRALLSDIGPLPAPIVADILGQVLAALAVAHDLGVLHRDLKPENIMLVRARGDDGQPADVVKVCDFGIAKIIERSQPAPGAGPGRRTTEGFVVGTPEYMSPEQAQGKAIDGRSDLYSVGIVLYELLTGQAPFEGSTPLSIVIKHLNDVPEPPSTRRADIDAGLEAICMRALQKSPEDRFQTAREMRQAVRAAVAPSPPVAIQLAIARARVSSGRPYRATIDADKSTLYGLTPAAPPPRRRTRPWLAVATLIAIAGATVVLGRRAAPPRPVLATATLVPTMSRPTTVEAEPAREPIATAAVPAPQPPSSGAALDGNADRTSGRETRARRTKAAMIAPGVVAAPETTEGSAQALPPPEEPGPVVQAAPVPVTPPASTPAAPPSTPAAAAPPEPSKPAYDLQSAHVEIALARNAVGATSSSVTRTLSEAANQMTACYRAELPRLTGVIDGVGVLHIETDGEGVITDTRWSGPFDGDIARCLAAAVTGRRVANVDTGSARADIPLAFRAR